MTVSLPNNYRWVHLERKSSSDDTMQCRLCRDWLPSFAQPCWSFQCEVPARVLDIGRWSWTLCWKTVAYQMCSMVRLIVLWMSQSRSADGEHRFIYCFSFCLRKFLFFTNWLTMKEMLWPSTVMTPLVPDWIWFSFWNTYESLRSGKTMATLAFTAGRLPLISISTASWSHTFKPLNLCTIKSSLLVPSSDVKRIVVVWFNFPPVNWYPFGALSLATGLANNQPTTEPKAYTNWVLWPMALSNGLTAV